MLCLPFSPPLTRVLPPSLPPSLPPFPKTLTCSYVLTLSHARLSLTLFSVARSVFSPTILLSLSISPSLPLSFPQRPCERGCQGSTKRSNQTLSPPSSPFLRSQIKSLSLSPSSCQALVEFIVASVVSFQRISINNIYISEGLCPRWSHMASPRTLQDHVSVKLLVRQTVAGCNGRMTPGSGSLDSRTCRRA